MTERPVHMLTTTEACLHLQLVGMALVIKDQQCTMALPVWVQPPVSLTQIPTSCFNMTSCMPCSFQGPMPEDPSPLSDMFSRLQTAQVRQRTHFLAAMTAFPTIASGLSS